MTKSCLMTAATLGYVQAVAFDLDGTLCDSIPDLTTATQAMCGYLGLPVLPAQMVEGYVDDGIGELIHHVITHGREKEADPGIWEKGLVLFMKYYREHLNGFTHPYPETEADLGLLKSLGIPLVVITSKNEVLAVRLPKQLNLGNYFGLVLGGGSLTEKKPSPLPLQHAAEVLDIDVANMLMVDDSRNDILITKTADCFNVGVTFGYGDMTLLSQDKATKPDLLIRALSRIYENLQPQENKDEE